MPKLTKSLHTVTSATAVAAHLARAAIDLNGQPYSWTRNDAADLASAALALLGHMFRPADLSRDETGARIVKNCGAILAECATALDSNVSRYERNSSAGDM